MLIEIDGRQHRGNSNRVGEGTVQTSTLLVIKQGQQQKASTPIILVQRDNIFRLLIGVPDYSISESYREKQKLEFIVIISQRGVCKS